MAGPHDHNSSEAELFSRAGRLFERDVGFEPGASLPLWWLGEGDRRGVSVAESADDPPAELLLDQLERSVLA